MAGIRLLEKDEFNINFIARHLMQPDIKRSWFDDDVGFETIMSMLKNPYTEIYGLVEKGDPIPFGVVIFFGVIPTRTAELMAVIFDKKNRNQGKMTSVVETIKQDMLKRKMIRSCSANVIGKNEASEKMLIKLGFKKIGTKSKLYFINGKYVDLHLYYLLLEEK